MLNSLIIDGDKAEKCPEQKFKNLSQEVLDISISFQNIQKALKLGQEMHFENEPHCITIRNWYDGRTFPKNR